jgi:hypothetical protein
MSIQKSQNGDRIADVKGEGILAGSCADLAASNMFMGLRLMSLASSFGRLRQPYNAVAPKASKRIASRPTRPLARPQAE